MHRFRLFLSLLAALVLSGVAIAVAATADSTLVHDTFDDRNGTALQDHAPDIGASGWVTELGTWVIKSGTVWEESKANEFPSSDYRAVIDSGSSDVRVEADIKNVGGSEFFGIVGRYEGPIDWVMAFYDGQGDIVLGMKQPDEDRFGNTVSPGDPGAGGFQEFGRVAVEWNRGKTRTLALVFNAADFSVELDGSTAIGSVSDSDNDNSGSTSHGIFTRGNGAARFDEFRISVE